MNSFYIEGCGEAGRLVQLRSEDALHAALVMRMQPGEQIYAVDEAGERFLAELKEVSREVCTALLQQIMPDNEAPVRITLYQGLPKAEKLELIVQKLTELGAARLIPLKMERCIVKLDEKDGRKRQERLQRIAREAAKQCRRGGCLEVDAPQTWRQLADGMRMHDALLVPWEDARGFGLRAAREAFPAARDIGIVIGPEGGMSEAEVRALEEMGARQISLGPRILRTETAAIASVAMAMLLWGDVG